MAVKSDWMRWSAVCCVTAAIMLSGCAGMPGAGDANLSPAQRQLRAETSRFNETVATGAVAGCLAGAVLGGLMGDYRGAAIGCAGGAVAGLATGYYVASQNQQYATAEAALNARIAAAQKEAQSYQAIAMTSQTLRAQNLAQIARLRDQVRSGKLTGPQFQEQTASINQDIDLLKKSLEECNKTEQQIVVDADNLRAQGASASQLLATKAQLENSRRQIGLNVDALVQALAGAG